VKELAKSYFNRRMAVLTAMGFASGLPLALVGDTLTARLTESRVDPSRVTLIVGFVQLPYAIKFFWSPLMDRFTLPWLGRRRGWIFLTQLLLVGAIVALALAGPGGNSFAWYGSLVLAATMVALVSATQDIVVDAYRADVLPVDELGNGAAVSITGYRIGMLASGAGAMLLVSRLGISWRASYLLMSLLMVPAMLATLAATEPPAPVQTIHPSLGEYFVDPVLDLVRRRRGLIVLALVLIFKLPEYLASAVTVQFIRSTGVSLASLATIRQGLGLFVLIAAAIGGGAVVRRFGIFTSLWLSAILHSVSNLSFLLLIHHPGIASMTAAVLVENASIGMTTSIFGAFLLGLCRPLHSATQYAILSGLMALSRSLSSMPAGFLVDHVGWSAFFPISAATGLLSLLLLPLVRTDQLSPNDVGQSHIPPAAVIIAA
jgi:PAT family beta-lactamase induction signal transducer AmpG